MFMDVVSRAQLKIVPLGKRSSPHQVSQHLLLTSLCCAFLAPYGSDSGRMQHAAGLTSRSLRFGPTLRRQCGGRAAAALQAVAVNFRPPDSQLLRLGPARMI